MGQGAGMVKPIYGAHSELVALATYFALYVQRYFNLLLSCFIDIHSYRRSDRLSRGVATPYESGEASRGSRPPLSSRYARNGGRQHVLLLS